MLQKYEWDFFIYRKALCQTSMIEKRYKMEYNIYELTFINIIHEKRKKFEFFRR